MCRERTSHQVLHSRRSSRSSRIGDAGVGEEGWAGHLGRY